MSASASIVALRRSPPPDEAAGRRALRGQVARLELQVAALSAELPVRVAATPRATAAGPRLQSLGELERTRDALVAAIASAHQALADREALRAAARRKLARMLADPGRHPFARVQLAELGEPGCGAYTVVPRLGLLGLLASWWEVKLSSGCP